MQRKHLLLLFQFTALIFLFVLFSCKRVKDVVHIPPSNDFDIILVIGQSNTHQGIGYNWVLDAPDDNIKQLGRFNEYNYKVIEAHEPLDHFSRLENNIGFALTFAKLYKNKYLTKGRNVLIIPGGMGGTGFSTNNWNVGNNLYADAVQRTNYILSNYRSKLVAILWHQGESDVGNPYYQASLDSMIVHLRKDISGNNDSLPFILGGLVPYWVDGDSSRQATNQIIESTVNRIPKTAYANPRVPFVIVKPDNNFVSLHFDAAGQREMGKRYFFEFRLIN